MMNIKRVENNFHKLLDKTISPPLKPQKPKKLSAAERRF